MRAAFALWLLQRGWDQLAVRDALAYERLKALNELLDGLRDLQAQEVVAEHLIIEDPTLEPAEADPLRTGAVPLFDLAQVIAPRWAPARE